MRALFAHLLKSVDGTNRHGKVLTLNSHFSGLSDLLKGIIFYFNRVRFSYLPVHFVIFE